MTKVLAEHAAPSPGRRLPDDAVELSKTYPVFPVRIIPKAGNGADKRPALSNAQLGQIQGRTIKSGNGGHKAASKRPGEVRAMFEAACSAGGKIEIGVPMAAAGLLALDFDLYKGGDAAAWVNKHMHLLEQHRRHRTVSGGLHIICEAPRGIRIPGKVAGLPDADIKHNGFIVWPRPGGPYSIEHDVDPGPMQQELIKAALTTVKGAAGPAAARGHFAHNPTPDIEFEANILAGEDYHDSLRTLGMRRAIRGEDADTIEKALRALLARSSPRAAERIDRLQVLLDPRDSELRRLCESAAAKVRAEQDSLIEKLSLGRAAFKFPDVVNGSQVRAEGPDWRKWFAAQGQR